jgi:hypothetical protein
MVNGEKDALLASLNGQREHLLSAPGGLSEEDLRRPVLPSARPPVRPSAWTALGLVGHLVLEVEQFRFSGAVAGEPITLTSGTRPGRFRRVCRAPRSSAGTGTR